MLRRKQPISATADDKAKPEVDTGPYGVDRRMDPRIKFDDANSETKEATDGSERRQHPRIMVETSNSENERREHKRRQMDAMRVELRRTTPPKAKRSIWGAIADKIPLRMAIKPSRIFLLVIALSTGGLAAFMATGLDSQPNESLAEPITQITQEARTKILVANEEIGIGQRLSPASLVWEDWPEGSVRADYITLASTPEALNDMNAVARFEIFPGDPIRTQKIVMDAQGYLSAVLKSGMRGVSVLVSAQSASGGFVVPNDHVDVILTPDTSTGQVSQTILQNVRVLAINSQLGETGTTGQNEDSDEQDSAQTFSDEVIVTLELDSQRSEIIISATRIGELSLVLRSMSDFSQSDKIAQQGSNQAIRLTSPFWTKTNAQASLL